MKTKKTTNAAASLSADEQLQIQEHIRIRAHELWLAGGHRVGNDLGDWLQAEQEVLAQIARPQSPRSSLRA
jgi:hypothetical protein